MSKQFAEHLLPLQYPRRDDPRRGNPVNEENEIWGFYPVWIVLPVLAVILVALLVALPVLYVTRDYAAQHDQTVKTVPEAMPEQLPDRKSTGPR